MDEFVFDTPVKHSGLTNNNLFLSLSFPKRELGYERSKMGTNKQVFRCVFGVVVIFCILILLWTGLWRPKILYEPFVDVWDERTTALREKVLQDTKTVLEDMHIDWFAAYGTLLGAVRHQGVIPWDDDVDILVHNTIQENMGVFTQKMKERGCVVTKGTDSFYYKVFAKNADTISKNGWGKKYKWKWPFIDIFFYDRQNDRVVWRNDYSKSTVHSYAVDNIFPLVSIPFNNLRGGIPVPRNHDVVLTDQYGSNYLTECVSTDYNHRKEKSISKIFRAPCSCILTPNVDLHTIPVYVINLKRRPDRWKATKQELQKVGLTPIRINATDATTTSFQTYYNTVQRPKRKVSEMACAASHLHTLRTFLRTNSEYALICEDDIIIPKETTYDILNTSFHQAKCMKLLLLGHCYSDDDSVCSQAGKSMIGTGKCLHAYVISREGAKDVLRTYQPSEPIDTTTQQVCLRTGGLCYISGGIACKKERIMNYGEGLIFQKNRTTDSDIERGLHEG